jgi:DNA helicase IV
VSIPFGVPEEQDYVSRLYDRLDVVRGEAERRLERALLETGGTPQARGERDAAITLYTDRVAQLGAVESGLCFGRLDLSDGERRYIGRIGLSDDTDAVEPLLMDWRATAARPFYVATAASPEGVRRRRHIRTSLRTVVSLEDEVLDLEEADPGAHEGLAGEAALLAALNAGRTGRMRDIVETIQAEQDRIIRSPLEGILVVQGGAGTGKTAVALHRAAYLLYTHRRQLSAAGVLVVGPNTTFLRYVEHVLPSLAETGVLLRTPGDLYPGGTPTRADTPEVAEIKGRLAMADVLAAAVRDRQWVPDDVLEVLVDEDQVLTLDRDTCVRAREKARRSGRPHNLARPIAERYVVAALARQLADRIGDDPYFDQPLGEDDARDQRNLLDAEDITEFRKELREDTAVQEALDRLWPLLTPEQLVEDLFGSGERLATAAPELAEAERAVLRRDPGHGWTPADVALLDEAAELLGEDEAAARERQEREHRERVEYAEGALEIARGSASIDVEDELDPELLLATDLLDADKLAERHEDLGHQTAAERAAADRRWTFGHVIVDEAQELSAMTWRLLMRRCPGRSMTLVGDVAQTSDLAGATSWRDALEPHVGGRWRREELAVCYRTPVEIMAVAAEVLARIDPSLTPPRSVREAGVAPWGLRVAEDDLADVLDRAVRREVAAVGDGRLGVLVPEHRLDAARAALPEAAGGDDPELESTVAVLTVRQAKGLEFDTVLLVDPDGITRESALGERDLYVALTRATQRLGVLALGDLPAGLATAPGSACRPAVS